MQDISGLLLTTIEKEQCTALTAFMHVRKKEKNELDILQPKPTKQVGGRLRDTSNRKING